MPALQRSVATGVAEAVSREPLVEGVFLAGSLVGDGADPFSDVDLGIVTIDGADQAALAGVLWRRIIDRLGEAVHRLERGWNAVG
jgi:predicted nucleotidyltransferase